MLKKSVVLIIIAVFICTMAFPITVGGSISDLQNKLAANEKKQEELKAQINELKGQKNSVQQEINKLDLELNQLNLEIEGYELKIQELNMEIAQKEQDIEGLIVEIDDNNETLENRLRVMYKNGISSYIDVIFNAKDPIDALTRLDMIQCIVQSDVDLLRSIETQKKEVEDKQEQLVVEKEEVTQIQNNVIAKKAEVNKAWNAKEQYMITIEQDIKEFQTMEARIEQAAKQLEKEIQAAQREVEYAGGQMLWPSPGNYKVTSNFGGRIHPINGSWHSHGGTDIGSPYGSSVVASNDGVVMFAGWHYSYGYYVVIDHGGTISTLYAHNSKLLVTSGQTVKRGEQIAKCGSTGDSTGPHVHFEVRENGVRVDPMKYLKK